MTAAPTTTRIDSGSAILLDRARVAPGGFSLLELVLIIAIIATLAAIAAPRYANSVARYRAEVTAHRIVADLELARATARATSASVTVVFDVSTNEYLMPGVPGLDDPSSVAGLILSDPPYRAQLVSAVFGIDTEVVFDGFGVPDSAGTVVLSCGGFTKTINLDAETGTASVQ